MRGLLGPRHMTAPRIHRIAAGLTLSDVARRTKYRERTIDQIEAGARFPGEDAWRAIGRITGATVVDFLQARRHFKARTAEKRANAAAAINGNAATAKRIGAVELDRQPGAGGRPRGTVS